MRIFHLLRNKEDLADLEAKTGQHQKLLREVPKLSESLFINFRWEHSSNSAWSYFGAWRRRERFLYLFGKSHVSCCQGET